MKNSFLLCISLLAISCADKSTMSPSLDETDKPIVQEKVEKPQAPGKESIDRPTRNFGVIVRLLDSLGFKSDTARVAKLKNYQELLDGEIQLFGNFPFYKMKKENARVLWRNTLGPSKDDSIAAEIFQKAESVWGYYYQKEERKNWRTDGVIEQWKFNDTATAQAAINKLKEIYPMPYFNTQPWYTTDGQFLFIFHTRADAFSYRQKEFFKKFKEISSAPDKTQASLPGLG